MIRGLGTDIVEIVRVGEMLDRHGEQFLDRVFRPEEVSYCQQRKAYLQHFAGRWAAKEAVMKAIGTGWSKGVGFRDIEVRSLASGQPTLVLHEEARQTADRLGIGEVLITISHCRAYATATAVAMASVGPVTEPAAIRGDSP